MIFWRVSFASLRVVQTGCGIQIDVVKDARIYLRIEAYPDMRERTRVSIYGWSRIVSEICAVFRLTGDPKQPGKSGNMQRVEGIEGGGLRFRVWMLDAEPLKAYCDL
jgi:hypothetical protein